MRKKIKRIKTNISRQITKGKELFTIMLIPHSEKHIFTFKISRYTIFFTALLLITIFIISYISLSKHPDTLKRQRHFQYQNVKYVKSLNKILVLTEKIKTSHSLLKRNFKTLLVSCGFNPNRNIQHDTHNISIQQNLEYNYPSKRYITEVRQFAATKINVQKIQTQTMQLIAFLKRYKNITHKIPSIWPVIGSGIITSGFGLRVDPFTMRPMFHPGIDISAFGGTPVRATANGKVVHADFGKITGNMVMIKHDYGISTAYYHLKRFIVSKGERVNRGDIVGYVGNTGRSMGEHLHYEVRINNKTVDPLPFTRLDNF